jgi:predicted dehydrogenase
VVSIPAPAPENPRWSWDLAGGALMDLGCYSLHAQRMLAPWGGGEPAVVGARGGLREGTGVDEWLDAELAFPSGATGSACCHMAAPELRMSCRIAGSRGEVTAHNFVLPQQDDRLVVRSPSGTRTERLGGKTSYTFQLEAFATAVREGTPSPLGAEDALTTMTMIDACYRAAGFAPRPRMRLDR